MNPILLKRLRFLRFGLVVGGVISFRSHFPSIFLGVDRRTFKVSLTVSAFEPGVWLGAGWGGGVLGWVHEGTPSGNCTRGRRYSMVPGQQCGLPSCGRFEVDRWSESYWSFQLFDTGLALTPFIVMRTGLMLPSASKYIRSIASTRWSAPVVPSGWRW